MNCLRLDQIYLFLEGELSLAESREIQEHADSCPKCQQALETRKLFHKASTSLPGLAIPEGFVQQVMARIPSYRVSPLKWLLTLAAGFSSALLLFSLLVLFSNQPLPGLHLQLSHRIWDLGKEVFLFLMKFFKIVFVFIKFLREFIIEVFQVLTNLTSAISPGMEILIITLSILVISTLIIWMRKFILSGEKS